MPLAVSARAVLRAHFCAWLKQCGIFELISRSLAPRARRRLLISVDQITDILRRKVPPSLANHGEALCQAGSRRGTVCRIHTVLNPCAAIRAPIQFSSFACYQVSAALLKTRHVLIGRLARPPRCYGVDHSLELCNVLSCALRAISSRISSSVRSGVRVAAKKCRRPSSDHAALNHYFAKKQNRAAKYETKSK